MCSVCRRYVLKYYPLNHCLLIFFLMMLVPTMTVSSYWHLLIVLLRLIHLFKLFLKGSNCQYRSNCLRVANPNPDQQLVLCRLCNRSRSVGRR